MKKEMAGEAIRTQRTALRELFKFNIDTAAKTVEVKNDPFEIIVFDTETSGLDSEKDKIVQLSGIKYLVEDGKFTEIDRFDHFINQPEYDENKVIPDPIFEKENGRSKTFKDLTGITNAMLAENPTESELFADIYAFFGDNPIVAGHNVPFDYGFITAMYIRQGKNFLTPATRRIDTLNISRDLISKEDAPKKIDKEGNEKPTYALGPLAGMYGIDNAEDSSETIVFHNSMNDVIVTARLLQTLVYEFAQRELEEAIEEASKPVITKERAIVKSISFWEGYRGFSRIYVNATLRGSNAGFYYDVRGKKWGEKDEGTMVATDMDLLIKDTLDLAGVSTETEFAKVKENITADEKFLERYKKTE